MSALSKIAFHLGARDEVPNQVLAHELALTCDHEGIKEIADHLIDRNPNISNDCIKVMYEIGYIQPSLIAPYYEIFLKLLTNKQNRLVWGAMIALATIAPIQASELFAQKALICKTVDEGSVITQDNGIKTLSLIAAANPEYQKDLFPYLLNFIRKCRLADVPRHAESIQVCVNDASRYEFVSLLESRISEMSSAQSSRIKKVIKNLS